jgi:hypothetical protein
VTDAERVARNDAAFREANERIEQTAESLGVATTVPFICECADTNCTTVIRLPLSEYEAIRVLPTLFMNAPGHEVAGRPHLRVVSRHETYVVIEKTGKAAEIVTQLDERSPSSG